MAVFIHTLNERTIAATFSGLLTQADRDAFEAAAREMIAQVGQINALFLLKDFAGLSDRVDWGRIEFYADHADDIVKMAIVGDPKWESQASLFTGRGARKTQIRFFPLHEFGAAQQWVTP